MDSETFNIQENIIMGRLLTLTATIIVLTFTTAFAASEYEIHPTVRNVYEDYIVDHFEAGLRITHFQFKDPTQYTRDASGNITGGYTAGISTYDLEEEQSYMPTIYLRYNVIEYITLQFSWEYLKGKAWNIQVPPYPQGSDGDLILSGPSFSLYGRYPIEFEQIENFRVAPYAGVGIVFFKADFEQDSEWHADGLRNMEADDTTGYLLTLGTSVTLWENIEADLSISSLKAEPSAKYWYRGRGTSDNPDNEWDFPADSWLYQFAVKYVF